MIQTSSKFLQAFLTYGASMEEQMESGHTPLLIASQNGHVLVAEVSYLLQFHCRRYFQKHGLLDCTELWMLTKPCSIKMIWACFAGTSRSWSEPGSKTATRIHISDHCIWKGLFACGWGKLIFSSLLSSILYSWITLCQWLQKLLWKGLS